MCLTTLLKSNKMCDKNMTSDNSDYIWPNCSSNMEYNQTYTMVPEYDSHNSAHDVPYNRSSSQVLIDVSKYYFPNVIWYIIPTDEVILKTATFIPVILFGVLGNLLLLAVISRNRNLKTPTNLLIANMAFADLLTLAVCPAMFMVHDFYQNYNLGATGCKMEGFLLGALLITGVLNLVAVSYDRLTAIVLPQETRLTIRGALIVMGFTWIAGFTLSLPLAIYRTYKERQWKDFLESYCSENTSILPMYWHVLISALVWFPLAVMLICYSAIFWKLDRYEANVLKREHPIAVSYKTKVAKTLFIVVLTFIALRLPFTTLVFLRNQMLKNSVMNQVQGSFTILWYASHYLIFVNAAVNPLIYGLTNENFRRAYRQMPLLRTCCRDTSADDKQPLGINNRTLFKGMLQPRGPCGDEKLSTTGRWFNFTNRKKTSSMATSTTSTYDSMNGKNGKTNGIKIISRVDVRDGDFYNSGEAEKPKSYEFI